MLLAPFVPLSVLWTDLRTRQYLTASSSQQDVSLSIPCLRLAVHNLRNKNNVADLSFHCGYLAHWCSNGHFPLLIAVLILQKVILNTLQDLFMTESWLYPFQLRKGKKVFTLWIFIYCIYLSATLGRKRRLLPTLSKWFEDS